MLDVTDPMDIQTEAILEEKSVEKFDLFRELLAESEGSEITCKKLNIGTIEAQLVSRMFCSTFGGPAAGGLFGGPGVR